jgi:hypothetical protein
MKAAQQDLFPGFTYRRVTVTDPQDSSSSVQVLKHMFFMMKQFPLLKDHCSDLNLILIKRSPMFPIKEQFGRSRHNLSALLWKFLNETSPGRKSTIHCFFSLHIGNIEGLSISQKRVQFNVVYVYYILGVSACYTWGLRALMINSD